MMDADSVDPEAAAARDRIWKLSEREREVLVRVLDGKPSRQIAAEMFISVKAVELHRACIMEKLEVRSAAELFSHLSRRQRLLTPRNRTR
jgi:FixJ family two-component response regulator